MGTKVTRMFKNKWIDRFLELAELIATWSKDPSTKVGAIAVSSAKQVLCEGYNGFPRGVHDLPERMERPAKYLWTLHAEANLVAHAARHGISLYQSSVFVTHYPCAQCAALLINAGVSSVYIDVRGKTNMPGEHFVTAALMFQEAGINVKECQKGEPEDETDETDDTVSN